jgi:hypothetical protein
MYSSINRKFIINAYLFTFLFFSFTWASPTVNNKPNSHFSWENTQINIDFALGPFTYSPLFKIFKVGSVKEKVSIRRRDDLNISLEALAVYNITTLPMLKANCCLEVGIIYPFPRPVEVSQFNIIFTEHHIKLPLHLKILRRSSRAFGLSLILGYELEIVLSSQYKQSGYYSELPTSMCGNKNISTFLPNTPRWWNNFIFATRFEFPKGIHLHTKTIFTTAPSFSAQAYYDKRHELDNMFVALMRGIASPILEVGAGVNIMEWFFPKEELQQV